MEISTLEVKGKTYKEQYRPQFHFSPQEKWMNDPNGLVYNNGVYHLFYQYYPEDIVWGPMHWGHAISKDMVHWEQRPIALFPDEKGYIFSGSAVVDVSNSSGFGSTENPPLVAIFTYHDMAREKDGKSDYESQAIAFSLDNGETWTKYEGNPVIPNNGSKDFRDPKVFWHEKTNSWILVLVAGDHAQIYRSKNLKDWTYLSDFGQNMGAHGGVWECPDLFPLRVGDTNIEKWVLLISINPGAPNGGSGTQYFIGDFDGTTFTTEQADTKWIDWGTDNYAGVTYNNVPNEERIFIGWMSNWEYARDTPTKTWRSAMTLPRSLHLNSHKGELFLENYPLKTVDSLRTPREQLNKKIASNGSSQLDLSTKNQTEILLETEGRNFKLIFENDLGDTYAIDFNEKEGVLISDRTKSGNISFKDSFGSEIHTMPLKNLPSGSIEVRLFLDWSSIEIFVNKGQKVMTSQIFPREPYSRLRFENHSEDSLFITNLRINEIKSIWD